MWMLWRILYNHFLLGFSVEYLLAHALATLIQSSNSLPFLLADAERR
ncbi:hypothetical protein XBFM1_2230029 [Xenorhabdus bovienii str. feltiae Moldova]|uniref:Uncharacterized protein n=1 Tax=Xenorhabdus bovienii str. feltiae Moldova TaxID=1398200 RepID=A0A077NT14_XENBV|nr:hypothetical protein XBFM1_2230029 [Xenorhabdus bovienii str. feltiae Moldova]